MRKIALQTSADSNQGLAISSDGVHMVTSHSNHTLSVYSLPGGEHIRTFGSEGAGEGQFNAPSKACFSVTGNILVTEYDGKRVQEVTLTGDHVRFIGVGVIDDFICGIATNSELIVVGKWGCASNSRIMMFDAVTGAFVTALGAYGDAPGQLLRYCWGIRFTPDSRHIIVAENMGGGTEGRLSVFTLGGEFVRCIGEGMLTVVRDAEFADNGDVIVCEGWSRSRISVCSADGNTLLRLWERKEEADWTLKDPTALATCGGQLYVLEYSTKCVQVFQ